MAVITKLIYGFTLSKPPANFFGETDKLIPKVPMEIQETKKRQNNLEKKKKIGEFILFDFLTYYRSYNLKTIWY